MGFKVMSIYPTASSTKAAVFDGEREIRRAEIRHDPYDIHEPRNAAEQFSARRASAEREFRPWLSGIGRLDAVIGCGLLPSSKKTGLYYLDEEFLMWMKRTWRPGRIINQGAMMASHIAHAVSARAFALVPFSSGEVDPVYRISGLPGMNFGRMTHTLLIKHVLRLAALDLGKPIGEISLIIARLGKTFSFCSHSEGRIRDFSNSFERGPFSQGRSGSVPATAVVRMAFSGMWSKIDLMRRMNSEGGVESYTGVQDMNEIIARANSGDVYSALVINSLVYQVASEIASQATALRGKVDAVAMIGEFAVDEFLAGAITERISWITNRVLRYSEEDELRIIAYRALRALKGEETPNLCVRQSGRGVC